MIFMCGNAQEILYKGTRSLLFPDKLYFPKAYK
jgi:hypothetical protein